MNCCWGHRASAVLATLWCWQYPLELPPGFVLPVARYGQQPCLRWPLRLMAQPGWRKHLPIVFPQVLQVPLVGKLALPLSYQGRSQTAGFAPGKATRCELQRAAKPLPLQGSTCQSSKLHAFQLADQEKERALEAPPGLLVSRLPLLVLLKHIRLTPQIWLR